MIAEEMVGDAGGDGGDVGSGGDAGGGGVGGGGDGGGGVGGGAGGPHAPPLPPELMNWPMSCVSHLGSRSPVTAIPKDSNTPGTQGSEVWSSRRDDIRALDMLVAMEIAPAAPGWAMTPA